MPRYQHINTTNNSQSNLPPLEPSYPTTAVTEYSNIAEAWEIDLRKVYIEMVEDLKDEMSNSLKEI